MSKIIVIEGPDRCGKATQTRLLRATMASFGISSTVVEVPIQSAVTYKIIYWMLQNGLAKKFPKLFQVFQFLNRKVFQLFVLPQLKKEYDVIIFDRWSLSTIVYGGAAGVSEEFTVKLSKKLLEPDHTFILLGKSFPHHAEDVYERDEELQAEVRARYYDWAVSHPETVTMLDCQQNKTRLSKQIFDVLKSKGIIQNYR